MATWIHPETEDIETLYVLMRQSLTLSHSLAENRFTTTAYLLRVAAEALEDDMRTYLKQAAEREVLRG